MIYFFIFLIIAAMIAAAIIIINNLVIKKNPNDKKTRVFRLVLSIVFAVMAGIVGFFLSFAIGESLVEVLSANMTMVLTFGGVSLYNFIACFFIARYYPRSIWFAWFLINPVVWFVLIANLAGSGGFFELWWGWTTMLVFAFGGSFIGAKLIIRKSPPPDNAGKN